MQHTAEPAGMEEGGGGGLICLARLTPPTPLAKLCPRPFFPIPLYVLLLLQVRVADPGVAKEEGLPLICSHLCKSSRCLSRQNKQSKGIVPSR